MMTPLVMLMVILAPVSMTTLQAHVEAMILKISLLLTNAAPVMEESTTPQESLRMQLPIFVSMTTLLLTLSVILAQAGMTTIHLDVEATMMMTSLPQMLCVCGGGSFDSIPANSASPTPTGCVNDDSVGDSFGDTCSAWYDDYPSGCGNYDTVDFTAVSFCCACGGGVYDGSVEVASDAGYGAVCASDLTTSDSSGDSCTWYDLYSGQYCEGTWDDADFSAVDQCCSCGGGVYSGSGTTVEATVEATDE